MRIQTVVVNKAELGEGAGEKQAIPLFQAGEEEGAAAGAAKKHGFAMKKC